MRGSLLISAALGLLLVACAGTRVELPPLVAGSGQALPGKFVWHDLLTDRPRQTRAFYGELFGWEFEALPGMNYELIRLHGEAIGGMVDQTRLPTRVDISQWVAVLSVADVERSVAQLRQAGGTVFTAPVSLGSRGRIAVVADPEGAVFAMLQGAGGDPPDRPGPPLSGDFLWDELWARAPARAAAVYQQLAPFALEQKAFQDGEGQLDYQVLHSGGRPRAGIRLNPLAGLPSLWLNYLRVRDEAELDAILARVETLGGAILVPATARPEGGQMAIIAGPSGAGIALQTWGDRAGADGGDA